MIVTNESVSNTPFSNPPERQAGVWKTALKVMGIAALVLGGITLIVLTSVGVLPAILFGAITSNYVMGSLLEIGAGVASAIIWKGKSTSDDIAKNVPADSVPSSSPGLKDRKPSELDSPVDDAEDSVPSTPGREDRKPYTQSELDSPVDDAEEEAYLVTYLYPYG